MTARKSTMQLPVSAACGVEKTGVKLGVEHVNAFAGGKHQGFGEKHSIPPADGQLLRIPETIPYT